MKKIFRMRRPSVALMSLALLVMTGLAAWMLPEMISSRAAASPPLAQQLFNKGVASARLNELAAEINTLKQILATGQATQATQLQYAARVAEYDALSAQMGGDRAVPTPPPSTAPAPGPKDATIEQMRALETTIASLRQQLAANSQNLKLKQQLDAAQAQYNALSASMGGDRPEARGGPAPNIVAPAPAGCTVTTTAFTQNTPVAIPTGPAVVTSTLNVAGAGTYLWDVDLTTFMPHTFAADLDVTITSPAGTVVTLTTDNGAGNDNVFNGTLWDDQATTPVSDFIFANNVVAPALQAEEAMGAFIGEDPNGTWTITISDDLAGDGGSLDSWTLDISTLTAPPTEATMTFANNTPVPINDTSVNVSNIVVAGAGASISKITVTTDMPHTFAADLDVTLTSPSGTVVTLTTDNGAGNDNVFAGTLWDDDANPAGQVPYVTNAGLVTDHPYVNLTLASPLVVEGSLAKFRGEDPNGNWTLTITDDLAGDTGTLNSWSIDITTATCAGGGGPCVCSPTTFTQNVPTTIPTGPAVVTSTVLVSGVGAYLYDVNVTTFLQHTFAADLDVTIQSPAGTVVTLTTDNGAGNDDVFNGTVWDDNANPAGQVPYVTNAGLVTDHPYVNLTLASPLVPEEALAAFIGEDPNGTWTITISDDLAGDGGSLNSWSLDVCTLAAPPAALLTTATQNTPTAIPTGPAVVTSTIIVAGAGTEIGQVTLLTNLTHTFAADLDITLMSPAGTVVTLTTDNGAGNDNVFNGTLWDDNANPAGQVPYVTNNGLVTDHAYVNLTLASPLVPEEAMGAFIGEDPNGTWTITISDDLAGDGGSLDSWTLNITTISCANPCVLTCPANVSVSNDPNQCGAVVNYPPPMTSGGCAPVTCSPPSGSFFPVGTTTVTCTDGSASCMFDVTVIDTQPPMISCPANVTGVSPPPPPGGVCSAPTASATTFPDPTASDNCPGVTVACVPPSGSMFPVGTTMVTCTATDASGNTAMCSFSVAIFNARVQDNANPNSVLLFNTATGEYRLCCNGTTLTGFGTIDVRACVYTLTHNGVDRRVRGEIDFAIGRGSGALQSPAGKILCTISDISIYDDTSLCGAVMPARSGK